MRCKVGLRLGLNVRFRMIRWPCKGVGRIAQISEGQVAQLSAENQLGLKGVPRRGVGESSFSLAQRRQSI